MIFLEETVHQVLLEEGQLVLSLSDLDISWEMLETLFRGTYEQSKSYISVYDWLTDTISIEGKKEPDWAHVRHMTYNAYNNMQRFMPDVPDHYWEFNPYTKKMSSLMASNFSFEVAKYPTLDYLEWTTTFNNVVSDNEIEFNIPYSLGGIEIYNGENKFDITVVNKKVDIETFEKDNYLAKYPFHPISEKGDILDIEGELVAGEINNYEGKGYLTFTDNYDEIKLVSKAKFPSIYELDLTCELFYTWFKANLLGLIGSIKRQIDLEGVGLPFNFNADEILARSRELQNKVEELKGTKSHWSNF